MQRIGIFLRVARVLIISEIEVGDRIKLAENEINSKQRSLNVNKIFEILNKHGIMFYTRISLFFIIFCRPNVRLRDTSFRRNFSGSATKV